MKYYSSRFISLERSFVSKYGGAANQQMVSIGKVVSLEKQLSYPRKGSHASA